MRQGSRPAVPDDAAVVENLLEFSGGFLALANSEIRLAANVCRIKAGIVKESNLRQLDGEAACRSGLDSPVAFAEQDHVGDIVLTDNGKVLSVWGPVEIGDQL